MNNTTDKPMTDGVNNISNHSMAGLLDFHSIQPQIFQELNGRHPGFCKMDESKSQQLQLIVDDYYRDIVERDLKEKKKQETSKEDKYCQNSDKEKDGKKLAKKIMGNSLFGYCKQ